MIRRITYLPLSIALLLFPSVKYSLTLDGTGAEYYGFPIPWNSRALATSLAKEVYLLPLAIDLAFFGILGAFALRALAHLPLPARNRAVQAIWAGGLLSAASIAFVLSFGAFFQLWPSPGPFRIDQTSISIGL